MIRDGLKGLLTVLIALLAASTSPAASAAGFPSLFDTVEYRGGSMGVLPEWQRVLGDIERETPLYRQCDHADGPCEPQALLAWQAMLKSQEGGEPMVQLRAVNRFVNRWQARSDLETHERDDHWASPLTFLRHSGDCEDFAIMKYVSLRQLGFTSETLRVVVVQDVLRDMSHAVLAVHVEGQVLILDNLFQAVLPQAMVSQYLPYYSVNETARFAHLPPSGVLMATSPWDIAPSMVALP
ncbi:MAG: transglutaminase-like cysteine peptidase [Pseudomonadota bacterium]